MPDSFIRFSDLKDSHPSQIDGAHDLLALAHPDENSSTGYTSMTTTPNALGAHAVEDQTFVNLKTSNKTIRGAINQTLSNLAPDFNTTAGSTYSEGDCVLYNGALKKCINPNGTTSGTFIDADWTDIKAVDVGSGGGGGSWVDLTGTLVAGQTSVTIQDSVITTLSTIDYYTDVFGVNPTDVAVTTGQVVLTFEAQQSDVGVKVRVS